MLWKLSLIFFSLAASPAWSATPRLTSDDLRRLSLNESNITIIGVRLGARF
jgi:hypothetical protein